MNILKIIFLPFFGILLIITIGLVLNFSSKYILKKIKLSTWSLYLLLFCGIVLHEISHFILAILFRHKIVSVNLMSFNQNEIYGFVKTSYNQKNIYQRFGVFFIAVAPVILGLIFSLLLFTILTLANNQLQWVSISSLLSNLSLVELRNMLLYFLSDLRSILLIYLLLSISFTLSMSREDTRNMLNSFFISVIILLLLNVVVYFFNQNLYFFIENKIKFFYLELIYISIFLLFIQLGFYIFITLIRYSLMFFKIFFKVR